MRSRIASKLLSLLAAAGLLAVLAGPTLAVSQISNGLDVTPRTFASGVTVTVKADTNYEWVLVPNPYPSNFVIAVNYKQLQSPSIWYSTVPGGFSYVSNIGEIGSQPGWWFNDGGAWYGVGNVHHYVYTDFTSQGSCGARNASNWHGQTEGANSKGNPASLVTTDTSC
jgi:hypothetical protein